METLAMDGSTLPALKDLFPEHFFEHPELAMNPPRPGATLPQLLDAVPQLSHTQQQQEAETYQQEAQLAFNDGQFPPAQTRGRDDRRTTKRSYDVARGHGHPQPQDPYVFSTGPGGPIHPQSNSMDVHLHLPGSVQPLARNEGVDEGADEGEDDMDGLDDGEKRRHPCPRCGKRFNRPSSLKIHLNTHTGAKPYTCPFPGCGRTFNVSSNMRRHHRNHARRPPPPPLPPNSVYPIPIPSRQQGQRGRGRPAQHNPNPPHQTLSLPLTFDNSEGFREPHDRATQLYAPSSNERNSGSGRGKTYTGTGALMTPPYTNEGDEYEKDSQYQRNLYSQIAPYGAFGPGPGHSDPSSISGNPQINVLPGIMGMHVPMRMPGMSVGPFEMLPVDPALVGSHSGNGADTDADGEADADGEFDPELDADRDGDAQKERDGSEMRRPGPSTSNARASSDPNIDHGPRRQNVKPVGADGTANVIVSVPMSNGNGKLTASANGAGGMQFRQILVPMPIGAVSDPTQVAQYAQQYQTHYVHQLQQFQQQQQMLASNATNGMNDMHGGGGASNGAPFLPQMQLGHSYSNGLYYTPYLDQQQQQLQAAQLKVRGPRAFADGSGNGKNTIEQTANTRMQEHPQRNVRATNSAGTGVNLGGSTNEFADANEGVTSSNVTPGAAPAPPYKLYTYPPPEFPDGEDNREAAIDRAIADQVGELHEDENGESDLDDDDDDDDYTGKTAPKKRRDTNRGGATRGRSRGRARGSGRGKGRGRGRPKKAANSAVATSIATKADPVHSRRDAKEEADTDLQQAEESGRGARKKRRVGTDEEV